MIRNLLVAALLCGMVLMSRPVFAEANVTPKSACYVQRDSSVAPTKFFMICMDETNYVMILYVSKKVSRDIQNLSFVLNDKDLYTITDIVSSDILSEEETIRYIVLIPPEVINRISSGESFNILFTKGIKVNFLKLNESQKASVRIVASINY